ncbi:MAG: hypothetical protein QOE86_451, partial [Solirubrobacteraceae bacterium]|nr:hypothetical protein [Solirubrobacteraceae bacterium]
MDRLRRTSSLRRVATVGALAALLVPAGTAAAATKTVKVPVITSVTPMSAKVGDTLLIKGRNFRTGKHKNSVGFKSDGFAVVFVKSDVSTTKRIYVKIPARLEKVMNTSSGATVPTRFHLRILAARLGKAFTTNKLSPKIAPAPPAASGGGGATGSTGGTGTTTTPTVDARGPEGDCDGDGIKNKDETDADNDLLSNATENAIGTDSCNADTDGDGVPDGYEYQSAVDLNDDVYQSPDGAVPYPGKRPYANPLDGTDAKTDYDGDGLSLKSEYNLWVYSWNVAKTDARTLTPLSYSDGKQYSKSIAPASYDKWNDFIAWTAANGYRTVTLQDRAWAGFTPGANSYGLLDVNRSGSESAGELNPLDRDHNGMLSDDERDEDADGL